MISDRLFHLGLFALAGAFLAGSHWIPELGPFAILLAGVARADLLREDGSASIKPYHSEGVKRMPQVQIFDIETKFQQFAATAVQNLDAKSLHALADELDKINQAATGLAALEAELEAMAPAQAPPALAPVSAE